MLAEVVTDWFFALPSTRHAQARDPAGAATFDYHSDRPLKVVNHNGGARPGSGFAESLHPASLVGAVIAVV